MNLYVENSEDPTRLLLELISKCSKVAGHKTNTQISCISTANNEQFKKEIKTIIPFTIVSKRMKYLEVSLTKEVKD